MSTLLRYIGCLHSGRTSSDDKNLLLYISLINIIRLDRRIHRTRYRLAEHYSREASSAADTWAYIVRPSLARLIGKFTVTQISPAYHADICLTICDKLLCNPRFIYSGNRGNRNMYMLSYLLARMCMRCR